VGEPEFSTFQSRFDEGQEFLLYGMVEDGSGVGEGREGEETVICCKVDWLVEESARVCSTRDDEQKVGCMSA
jgi:hypothetical protein